MAETKSKSNARGAWSGQLGFILAAVGSAIGLGNIWRFPGVAYENGGGAFIVPYLCALLAIGLPILLLDYAIGHRFHGTPPLAFRRINKKAEFIGWWHVGVCFVIMTYYAVILAWPFRYIFFAVTNAWGDDPQKFFFTKFLETSSQTAVIGSPVWGVMIPLALMWVAVVGIIALGVQKGVERANKIFIPLLVVVFAALVVRSLLLPGAMEGLNSFFTPDWSAIAKPKVWMAAFAQIFFSMSAGFGIMLTYASYLRRKSNLTGTALVAGFANSSFEILAGIGVFSALGFMAYQQGMQVSDLEGLSGISLAFITFPKIISMMPGGAFFGILFFVSLTLAGVTSLLSLVQVVSGAFADKFGWPVKRAAIMLGSVAGVISLLLYGTTSGMGAVDTVDAFINSVGVVFATILMAVAVSWVWPKLKPLRDHLNVLSTVHVGRWWTWMVSLFIPLFLGIMLMLSIKDYLLEGYGEYPTWYVAAFGWGCVALCAVFAVVFPLVKWRDEESLEGEHDLSDVDWIKEAQQ